MVVGSSWLAGGIYVYAQARQGRDVDVDLRHAAVSLQPAKLSFVLFGRSLLAWKWRLACSTTLGLALFLSICSESKSGPVHRLLPDRSIAEAVITYNRSLHHDLKVVQQREKETERVRNIRSKLEYPDHPDIWTAALSRLKNWPSGQY